MEGDLRLSVTRTNFKAVERTKIGLGHENLGSRQLHAQVGQIAHLPCGCQSCESTRACKPPLKGVAAFGKSARAQTESMCCEHRCRLPRGVRELAT